MRMKGLDSSSVFMIFQGDAIGDMVSKTNVFEETLEIIIFVLVLFRH